MSTLPTGKEFDTPVAIDIVSVTDRQAFKKDRLTWFLHTVHRLEAPGSEIYLRFGTAMHAALAVYSTSKAKPAARAGATFRRFDTEWAAATHAAAVEWGFLWPNIESEYTEHAILGMEMLEGYMAADAEASVLSDYVPLGKTLAVEQRITVPIPGTDGHLTGKIDLRAIAGNDHIAWDRKNLSGSHSAEFLDTDDQLTAYAWLYREATGKVLDGVGYDVLLKKRPLTKSGKPTTSRLFTRDVSYRSPTQLDIFGRMLREEWFDMQHAAAQPHTLYPNPPSASGYSPRNPVWSIYRAILLGDDVEDVIRSGYVVGDVRD